MANPSPFSNATAYDWKDDTARVREAAESKMCTGCFDTYNTSDRVKMQSTKCGHVLCKTCVNDFWFFEEYHRKCGVKGCQVDLTRDDWRAWTREPETSGFEEEQPAAATSTTSSEERNPIFIEETNPQYKKQITSQVPDVKEDDDKE